MDTEPTPPGAHELDLLRRYQQVARELRALERGTPEYRAKARVEAELSREIHAMGPIRRP